jgi:hypothetical protein
MNRKALALAKLLNRLRLLLGMTPMSYDGIVKWFVGSRIIAELERRKKLQSGGRLGILSSFTLVSSLQM